MNELIEAIRAAVADGATAEQKAIGAQACRTILAALDAQPGKPIVLPGAPQAQAHPLSRLTLDQALDLAIARLTPVAASREPQQTQPPAAPRGLRIAMSPVTAPVAPAVAPPNRRKP